MKSQDKNVGRNIRGRYISKHSLDFEEELKFSKPHPGSFYIHGRMGKQKRFCPEGTCGNCHRCVARIRQRIYHGTLEQVEIPAWFIKQYQDELSIWLTLEGPNSLLSSSLRF